MLGVVRLHGVLCRNVPPINGHREFHRVTSTVSSTAGAQQMRLVSHAIKTGGRERVRERWREKRMEYINKRVYTQEIIQ